MELIMYTALKYMFYELEGEEGGWHEELKEGVTPDKSFAELRDLIKKNKNEVTTPQDVDGTKHTYYKAGNDTERITYHIRTGNPPEHQIIRQNGNYHEEFKITKFSNTDKISSVTRTHWLIVNWWALQMEKEWEVYTDPKKMTDIFDILKEKLESTFPERKE